METVKDFIFHLKITEEVGDADAVAEMRRIHRGDTMNVITKSDKVWGKIIAGRFQKIDCALDIASSSILTNEISAESGKAFKGTHKQPVSFMSHIQTEKFIAQS